MKVLIYTASSLCNPQFGIQMEQAINYVNAGNDVIFCYCAGVMSACSANPLKNEAVCDACKLGFRCGCKNLPANIKLKKLKKNNKSTRYTYHRFNSISDIKAYKYKGVDVGFSVMSVYASKTRNPTPPNTSTFKECINQLIEEAEYLVDAAEAIILTEKPDLIILFNGRFFDTKPFHNLAELYNIKYITTENIGGIRTGEEYRIMTFENTIPHDSHIIYKQCLLSWELSKKTENEKTRIGESFYIKRRNGQKAGDYIYTSSQITGQLPQDYDPQKKNIVIFTSSEDEYSSVSAKVDEYFIFSSQYDCIKYLSENIGDDSYHFIVRIHPNMSGLNVDYHNNLYKLSNKKNVTILSPEDNTSSYTLLDIAYNIVVFGSTIGAESIFWGKPVVLLGFSAYYEWGCCSIPRNKRQTIELVKNPIIYPKSKEISTKYGYYFLENNIAKSSNRIKITPKLKKVFGKNIYVFEYLKLLNSPTIYRIISTCITRIVSKFFRNRIKFPEKIIH